VTNALHMVESLLRLGLRVKCLAGVSGEPDKNVNRS